MKKLLLSLSVVCAVVLASCDNDNSVNPQPLGKATISGVVYADFNLTNNSPSTTYDVVANKKMIVEIYDNNGNIRYTDTTTDAEGKYLIELEVGNQELEVGLSLVDFRADVTTAGGVKSQIFNGQYLSSGIDVEKGGEYIRDIYYND